MGYATRHREHESPDAMTLSPRIATLAAVVLAAALLGAATAFLDQTVLLMAVLLSVIVATSGVILWRYRPGADALPLVVFLATYYLLAYGIGPAYFWLTGDAGSANPISMQMMLPALAVATLGWVGLLFGYFVNPLRTIGRVRLPVRVQDSGVEVLVRSLPVLALGWGARLLTVVNGTYFHSIAAGGEVVSSASTWTLTVLSTLPTLVLAVVGAYAYAYREHPSPRLKPVFLVMLAVDAAWYVPTGSRASLLGLVLLAAIISYYGGRKLPKKLLIASGLVLVFVVFPLYLTYRGNGDQYQSSPGDSMNAAVASTFSRSPLDFVGSGISATLSRFNDIKPGAFILSDGRDRFLPEAHGETLTWIAYSVFPRFVFPDKPDPGLFGNEVGRVTGMSSPTDYVTSTNFGQPFELFLTLGWIGTAVGMAILGAVYRLISDLTRTRDRNPLVLALYATSVLGLTTSLGEIVSNGLVGGIRTMAVYGVFLFFMSGGLTRLPVALTTHVTRRPRGELSGV